MPRRARMLFGTEEPVTPPKLLRAGPLTCELEAATSATSGSPARRRCGRSPSSCATRTGAPTIPRSSNLEVRQGAESFEVSYDARCKDDVQELTYRARITGAPDGSAGVRGPGHGGHRLPDQPHRLRHPAPDRGRGRRAGRGPACRRHQRAFDLPGADRSHLPVPGRPCAHPRGPAGRQGDLHHGGRCLRDGGSPQLERCLLQDLRAAARQALALHDQGRRDHRAVGAAGARRPGSPGRGRRRRARRSGSRSASGAGTMPRIGLSLRPEHARGHPGGGRCRSGSWRRSS